MPGSLIFVIFMLSKIVLTKKKKYSQYPQFPQYPQLQFLAPVKVKLVWGRELQ